MKFLAYIQTSDESSLYGLGDTIEEAIANVDSLVPEERIHYARDVTVLAIENNRASDDNGAVWESSQ
jgi:hypothetical protein